MTLGHLLGTLAGDKIAVIEGLAHNPSSDRLKAFCAAAASSGTVALFHAIGVTPEAGSLEEAFGGNEPERIIDIGPDELQKARSELSTAEEGDRLDAVVLGCPHFSFDEFRELADLVNEQAQKGNSLGPGVRFVVISSQTSHALLQRGDFLDVLMKFGIEITLDTCVFHTPMIHPDTKVIMTNSGKCSYYAPGELGVKVAFGSMAECIESAVRGEVCREETIWKEL